MSSSDLVRKITIVAQDPSVRLKNGKILTARVPVPFEDLSTGPRGHRVQVIDYDASTGTLYKPFTPKSDDPFRNPSNSTILTNPQFHCMNVYAVVSRTLSQFEFALGRRVSWGFDGHQVKVAPHAFADTNAFYSRRDEGIMFGYFRADKENVFTCLSHDIIAHETTHAILDGLRERYIDPSSPDQAAFHEGFADVVALLSVFSLPEVVVGVLSRSKAHGGKSISKDKLTAEALRNSVLFGLAEQMGSAVSGVRGQALRRSVNLVEDPKLASDPEFQLPHRRGELFAASVMQAFLEALHKRLDGLRVEGHAVDAGRVSEEAGELSSTLLTMLIRAIDYTPPVHITFADYLSAALTADMQVRSDDTKYELRQHLTAGFARFGIRPASRAKHGGWNKAPDTLSYDGIHFRSLARDPDEVFKFIWSNRKPLGLATQAYSKVLSVRPCTRVSPETGFTLHETVAELIQLLRVTGRDLRKLSIKRPDQVGLDDELVLYGGTTLIFDESGRLAYDIGTNVMSAHRQSQRLEHLANSGRLGRSQRRFASLHQDKKRGALPEGLRGEAW